MTKETVTDKIVDKLPDGNHAIDAIANIATQISNKVIAIAPKALEYILQIKVIDSIACLVGSVIALISALIAIGVLIKTYKYSAKRKREDEYSEWECGMIFSVVGLSIAAIVSFISMAGLLDVWTWVGIFKPDLAIAHDVYHSVIDAATPKK